MALGRTRRSFSASSESSQTQLMFDLGPRPGFPLADLFESVPYFLRFGRSEHVVGINHALGLDEHAIVLLAKRHEVSLPKLHGFKHFTRDDHLAALPHPANPLWSCDCLRCHTFRLSDE